MLDVFLCLLLNDMHSISIFWVDLDNLHVLVLLVDLSEVHHLFDQNVAKENESVYLGEKLIAKEKDGPKPAIFIPFLLRLLIALNPYERCMQYQHSLYSHSLYDHFSLYLALETCIL